MSEYMSVSHPPLYLGWNIPLPQKEIILVKSEMQLAGILTDRGVGGCLPWEVHFHVGVKQGAQQKGQLSRDAFSGWFRCPPGAWT